MVTTLKIVRTVHALSLLRLQAQSGINASNISLIERGVLTPTAAQLDALASALNHPAEELMRPFALDTPITTPAEAS